MPRFVIRRALLTDLEPLVALERLFPTDRLSRRSFRHLLTHANADVIVCATAGKLLGNAIVLYRTGARQARLYSLVVDPAARGCGIATRLVAQAQTMARRSGHERLHLEVRPNNKEALRLYRKLGYQVTARLPRFYEDGTPALRLEIALGRRR